MSLRDRWQAFLLRRLRKRLVAMASGVALSTLINIFHAKLGLDPAQAHDLATQIVALVSAYILGQSATDAVGIYKGSKEP